MLSLEQSTAHLNILRCNWHVLRRQLLRQWPSLTNEELNTAGPDCHGLANLIAGKYGLIPRMMENYLRNFERTLPLL